MDSSNNTANAAAPVGVFDSGLGGLTAVREIIKLLPHEDIIYFGDTGRVPYGGRSAETIEKYGKQAVAFLLSKGVKYILVACGTVSSVAGEKLRRIFPHTPLAGILEPACLAAADAAKRAGNFRVGVIATQATAKTRAHGKLFSLMSEKYEVYEKPCPLFVPLVENGYIHPNDGRGHITRLVAEEYLAPLREKKLSALILGCTHYPMIQQIIDDVINPDSNRRTVLINSGYEAAAALKRALKEKNLLSDSRRPGKLRVFISDKTINFIEIASEFLGFDISAATEMAEIEMF